MVAPMRYSKFLGLSTLVAATVVGVGASPAQAAPPAPTVALSETVVSTGETIDLEISGCPGYDTAFVLQGQVGVPGTPSASVPLTAAGTAAYTLTFYEVGQNFVQVQCQDASLEATETFETEYVVTPGDDLPTLGANDLAATPASAGVGDTVNLTATGLASQGPWVFLYPGAVLVGQVNTTAGVLADDIVIPPVAPGDYTLVVHDLGDNYGVELTVEPNEGFNAVTPERLFDTRPDKADGLREVPKQKIGGGTELTVKVTDLPGLVPAAGVSAVSMNVTAVQPDDFGYVTVYPCGTRPGVSSVNYVAGANVPNQVIAPVSADGEVCFYSYATTHLLADINGYFTDGTGFAPVDPARVLDTRPSEEQGLRPVTKEKIGGATELTVQVTDIDGYVPADGVSAVSLNVTVAQPEDFGYVTVYPCGTRPEVSSVNYVAGQIVANAVIAPVSDEGEICLYSLANTHVVVDINGYFPDGPAFTAVDPGRVFDTRPDKADGLRPVTKQKIGGATELTVKVTDIPGYVPADGVSAVSLNVTVAQPEDFGYATVYPCGARPEASNLNYVPGQVVANAVIAPVSAEGEICLYSYANAHVLADINGYFAD